MYAAYVLGSGGSSIGDLVSSSDPAIVSRQGTSARAHDGGQRLENATRSRENRKKLGTQ